MQRRNFLATIGAAAAAAAAGVRASADQSAPSIERIRGRWRELVRSGVELPSAADKLTRSEEEWRSALEPMQFRVLREAATEPAHSSPLNAEKRQGVYVCAGCELPLFTSEMKFDSGTGWPSFFTTVPEAFETELDFVLFIPRTEYHCARCGGHHGHVFDDGPPPTHERWCNNGVALRFIPTAAGA